MAEEHFHVWIRTGHAFIMRRKRYADRTTAHRAAVRERANPKFRFVLSCDDCVTSARSKRKPRSWGRVAREVAADLGAPAARVREALRAALEREDARRRSGESSGDAGATGRGEP